MKKSLLFCITVLCLALTHQAQASSFYFDFFFSDPYYAPTYVPVDDYVVVERYRVVRPRRHYRPVYVYDDYYYDHAPRVYVFD